MDELRTALELATEEEIEQLTHVLFCRRLNPLDYWRTPAPLQIHSQEWDTKLTQIEQRFRFLGADGVTVLRGKTDNVAYRDILIQVCRYLKIPYSLSMTTIEIEAEIFLEILQKAWYKLPSSEQKSLRHQVVKSLAESTTPEPLPMKLQHDPLQILLRGSGFLAISSVLKSWLLGKIARQFALHLAGFQAAKATIIKGGIATAGTLQNQLALQVAKRGMVTNMARYTAVRGVFTFLGPILWGYFFADLGWRAIATNYTRIIPVIFTLAQIRLTRGDYLVSAVASGA